MQNLVDTLQQNQPLLMALIFFFGAIIGSFLNVVIHRIPLMLQNQWENYGQSIENANRYDLAWPPSHCTQCKKSIGIMENIPLVSYFWLRGKCRYCKSPISPRYFLTEISVAIIAVLVALYYALTLKGLGIFLFICFILAMSVIDFRHRLLPDMLTLPLLWLGLLFNLSHTFALLSDAVIGAVAGYMSFYIIYQTHHLLTGRHGMGYGDFKLFAAIGAWLGWQALPVVALIASICGIFYAGLMLIFKQEHKIIPFGPFLAIGGLIMLLFGKQLLTLYITLII